MAKQGMKANTSIIGRLLEEMSWEGNAVGYRRGGAGRENVLTAEVMLCLDFLPRTHFLGEVLRAAHGADRALGGAAAQIEDAKLSGLPLELTLPPLGTVVQPDVVLETASVYVLVEAKRIKGGSFQREQLAREYLAVVREAGTRSPVLLLILGSPPPVTVKGQGLKDIADAIREQLPQVLDLTGADDERLEDLVGRVPMVVSWLTWAEVDAIIARQLLSLEIEDPSFRGTVGRLATAVAKAIAIHSSRHGHVAATLRSAERHQASAFGEVRPGVGPAQRVWSWSAYGSRRSLLGRGDADLCARLV